MKEYYMQEALHEAEKSLQYNDVPVGCVIVKDDQIIGRGHNNRYKNDSTIGHAEINAIIAANQTLQNWVLEDCELYVTIEPCQMCTGAIIQSRLKKVYFGARDEKSGCVVSMYQMFEDNRFNHTIEFEEGLLQEQCGKIIKDFFNKLRRSK